MTHWLAIIKFWLISPLNSFISKGHSWAEHSWFVCEEKNNMQYLPEGLLSSSMWVSSTTGAHSHEANMLIKHLHPQVLNKEIFSLSVSLAIYPSNYLSIFKDTGHRCTCMYKYKLLWKRLSSVVLFPVLPRGCDSRELFWEVLHYVSLSSIATEAYFSHVHMYKEPLSLADSTMGVPTLHRHMRTNASHEEAVICN